MTIEINEEYKKVINLLKLVCENAKENTEDNGSFLVNLNIWEGVKEMNEKAFFDLHNMGVLREITYRPWGRSSDKAAGVTIAVIDDNKPRYTESKTLKNRDYKDVGNSDNGAISFYLDDKVNFRIDERDKQVRIDEEAKQERELNKQLSETTNNKRGKK